MTEPNIDQLKHLRDPFPANQIGKLPKGGLMLDFVGHGWLTQRLLDVDPLWNWEPFSLDQDGLPRVDEHGGLWIRLTVCGVTRIGYGEGKGPEAIKIAIGDALRNAGMRFGLALDLWCKGDPDAPAPPKPPTPVEEALVDLGDAVAALGLDATKVAADFYGKHKQTARGSTPEKIRAFINELHDKAEAS
jgi:hypothetical protein